MAKTVGKARTATKRGRGPNEVAASGDRGRWNSPHKVEVVLRLIRGEDLDRVSCEVGVSAAMIGEFMMENELLHEKVGVLRGGSSPLSRRSSR